jgi:hypothetical protein
MPTGYWQILPRASEWIKETGIPESINNFIGWFQEYYFVTSYLMDLSAVFSVLHLHDRFCQGVVSMDKNNTISQNPDDY